MAGGNKVEKVGNCGINKRMDRGFEELDLILVISPMKRLSATVPTQMSQFFSYTSVATVDIIISKRKSHEKRDRSYITVERRKS